MSERYAVQNPMIKYAQQIGWAYVRPDEALRLRGGETGRFFTDVLVAQLVALNPGVVDPARAAEVIRQLSFQVTDEWRHKSAVYANRADVVFLINGIPIAIAETKGASKANGMEEGVRQIRRYHAETPELLAAPQLFEVTQLWDFLYGATWSLSRKNIFNWKEELAGAEAQAIDYEHKVKAFFDREPILKVLRDYIIFLARDDELSKVILRQHQARAVEQVIERVYDPSKRRGLIWHTQGSGKTLTMITIAAKLLREAQGGTKPTVLMLVDRNELEAQLFKNITGYGIEPKLAESKRDLQQILASDYRAVCELYATVQLAYSQRIYTDPDLTEKTRRLLREHTSLYSLELPGTIHELGPAELAALKHDDTSETVKVLNLSKAIAAKVEHEALSDPFLISIGEHAEALKQSYEDRQLSTQQALAEFERLAQQIVDAGSERHALGLSVNAFAVYTALRAFKANLTADEARMVDAVFAGFPDYKWNQQQTSALVRSCIVC